MKKLFKNIALSLIIALTILPQTALASVYKPCTMINYKTGYKQAVYSQVQAKKLFSLGYELDKNLLGFSVVTNYSTTLSSSINLNQTTIPVGTTKDKKGVQLATSTLGMKIYLNIEPGGKKEELVVCTGISGNSWTGCTRGLAFSGTDESSVAENQYSHSQGSVVVMSNIHYVYNQFVDKINPTSESTYTPTTDYNLTTKTWVENRNGYWEGSVANFAALPLTNNADGAARVTLDDSKLYVWSASSSSWNLAGAGGGAGTVYIDTFLGTESTGDDNKTFTLTSGSFPDKKYLQVYKNGVLQVEGTGNDYVATGSNQAVFEDVVLDDDVITLLVVSVDLYNPAWNNVTEDLIPDVDATHDIGSTTKKFKDLHLSGDANIDGLATFGDIPIIPTTVPTIAGQVIALDANSKLPAVDGRNLIIYLNSTASDNLKISIDEVASIGGEGSGFLRQIRIARNGVIRVKAECSRYPGHPSSIYIQKNGVTVLQLQNADYPTFGPVGSVDIPVASGDLIQIFYVNGNNTATSWVKNFRIYYDDAPISDIIIQ